MHCTVEYSIELLVKSYIKSLETGVNCLVFPDIIMINRFMRLLLMFDMPTITNEDKKNYTKFRDNLIDDGFIMIQYSVYVRICKNQDDIIKHTNRVKLFAPAKGNIRLLQITEKQYEQMLMLRGIKNDDEKVSNNSMIIIE